MPNPSRKSGDESGRSDPPPPTTSRARSCPGDPADYDWYYDLALYYQSNGLLWRVIWDRWHEPQPGQFTDYGATAAAEFRFDTARGRYLMVRYDTGPDNSPYPSGWTIAGPVLWTDYPAGGLSPVPYLDVETDASLGSDAGGVWDPVRRWFGLGGDQTLDPSTGDVLQTAYWAGDLIDSTMAAMDATGFPIDYAGGSSPTFVHYSAFGEVLDASGTPGGSAPAGFPRYQYAGGWGYESDLLALPGANSALTPITLQHLGWRWYDPATGRFVQRDPLNIAIALRLDVLAPLNRYAYAVNTPLSQVDPPGLQLGNKEYQDCLDECDAWYATIGSSCGLKALDDCYASCSEDYWPPVPGSPPPSGFNPWPGRCPPCSAGRPPRGGKPPGGKPKGGTCGLTGLIPAMLAWILWHARWRRRVAPNRS